MMLDKDDSRLREAEPIPEGAILRPLDCRGAGSHVKVGYRCANYGLAGCLSWVCKRCADKSQPHKPFTEECNVCQLAVKNGCSITKALSLIAELHPESVRKGKSVCASFAKGATPCGRCVRHVCKHCETDFRSHSKASAYCGDICRKSEAREANRQRQDRFRQNAQAA
jgi:hypothetical protein